MASNGSVFNPDAQHDSVDHKILAALERLSHVFRSLLWQKVTGVSAPHGLTPTQVQLLIFLRYHAEEMGRVGVLAAEFGLSAPTVSDAVRVLEEKGLITKRVSKHDARVRVLRLTARGKTLTNQVSDWANALFEHTVAFSDAEKAAILRFLMNLMTSLQRHGIVSVSRMCTSCRFFSPGDGDGAGRPHYCRFLKTSLAEESLRVDCPEHEPAEELG